MVRGDLDAPGFLCSLDGSIAFAGDSLTTSYPKTFVPGTELETSRLGFGTASLHHLYGSRDRQRLLGIALDSGLCHFDTARIYGHGLAERELGKFLRQHRKTVTIGTKFGIPANPLFERWPLAMYAQKGFRTASKRLSGSRSGRPARRLSTRDATASLASSLRALQTDWVDLLLVHEPDVHDVGAISALSDWLWRQKREGRARYLGLAGRACDCAEIARRIPGLFDVLQVEDSMKASEADAVLQVDYPLQITFGYLRRALSDEGQSPDEILRGALRRNPDGVVLVSSRNVARVQEFGRVLTGWAD